MAKKLMRMFGLVFVAYMLVVIVGAGADLPGLGRLVSHNYNISNIGYTNEAVEYAAAPKYGAVYLGGMPIGLSLSSKGALIIGVGEVNTQSGIAKPCVDAGLVSGDIIIDIQGEGINNVADLDNAVNKPENQGKPLNITFVREGKTMNTVATAAIDSASGKYKLGLWIRDSAAGIGTVTYMKPTEGGRVDFGALGHPICDADTGVIIPILKGEVFKCNILGVNKSVRGTPGELRGVFLREGKFLGSAFVNNKFGVFGRMESKFDNNLYPELVEVAGRRSVKPGKATILSSVDNTIKEYEIEIVKACPQKCAEEKSLVIRITDKDLLERTGGIVQGMSGSPIIQNGKLVGAVTHVFISDPTKGFGVYADWMLEQARIAG